MREQDYRTLFDAIHKVARNIRSLAESIDSGHPENLSPFEYLQDYSYDALIFPLAQAGLAHAEDSRQPPSPVLTEKVNPVLAPSGTDIQQLYQDARKGSIFIAKNSWEGLNSSYYTPVKVSDEYQSLHHALHFLGIRPGSPEMCELLDTTPEAFRRIDKSYALAGIYNHLRHKRGLLQIVAGQLAPSASEDGEVRPRPSLENRLEASFTRASNPVGLELKRLMEPFGLTFKEVSAYIVTRLEMEGQIPKAESSPGYVH
ncbi:MAG: hypothetical protein IPH06_10560 [Alphaproteobacteria bacterium]|jgi:hypothetical protein|nr:hypothetical protein [Alphaproteobacteria bacterium]QQS58426.1 MAG: hypothetical protein IPN28_06315 [Alphaproteobacteria bacterium]